MTAATIAVRRAGPSGSRLRGVRTIAGRIVGDDNAFDDEALGFGWSWDDLPDDYAAGVSALQFNENAVRLAVAPGASGSAISRPIAVGADRAAAWSSTATVDTAADRHARRASRRSGFPASDRLVLRGRFRIERHADRRGWCRWTTRRVFLRQPRCAAR